MSRNSLSFILTLYKPTSEQLDYWYSKSLEIFELGYDFFVLVDNPDLEKLNFPTGVKVFLNEENIGKFSTVYNFIKKDIIKTSHLKIVDPDDEIDIDELKKFEICSNGIIMMQNKIENQDGSIEIKEQFTLGTSWTILPVNEIRKDVFFSVHKYGIRNWLEDQILGIISYLNGAGIERQNDSWYVYKINSGMSHSKINIADLDEIINALKVVEEMFSFYNGEPQTNFPGHLFFIRNLVKNSDLEIEKKKNAIFEIDKFRRELKFK